MANIIKKSKGNPYKLSNNISNTPKKSLTLSSVKTVSPFKYDIKVFRFDQSHGIFRKRLNNINNARHILFCERVPMRQNTHTHTHTTTTYDIDKPKYRTGAGSGNNKILNTIVGRSILISNFKDSATKQLALIWFRHAVASKSVAQHGARSIIPSSTELELRSELGD